MDAETGRVRRRAVFGDESAESDDDDDDDEAVSEDDRVEGSSSGDETEEEEGAAPERDGVARRRVKRQRLDAVEEDAEVDLPAFADSDDDLERGPEDGEAEAAEESSEEDAAVGKRAQGQGQARGVGRGGRLETATLGVSDSGHCTAEEAFASEDESEGGSSVSAEEGDSESGRGWLRPENSGDEASGVEELLGGEEDFREDRRDAAETAGRAAGASFVGIAGTSGRGGPHSERRRLHGPRPTSGLRSEQSAWGPGPRRDRGDGTLLLFLSRRPQVEGRPDAEGSRGLPEAAAGRAQPPKAGVRSR